MYPSMRRFNTFPHSCFCTAEKLCFVCSVCVHSKETVQLLRKRVCTCKTAWAHGLSEECFEKSGGKFSCHRARHCPKSFKVYACGRQTKPTELCLSVCIGGKMSFLVEKTPTDGGRITSETCFPTGNTLALLQEAKPCYTLQELLGLKVFFHPEFYKQWVV